MSKKQMPDWYKRIVNKRKETTKRQKELAEILEILEDFQ